MKKIIGSLIIIFVFSCNTKVPDGKNSLTVEEKNQTLNYIGDSRIDSTFKNLIHQKVIIIDSLKNHPELKSLIYLPQKIKYKNERYFFEPKDYNIISDLLIINDSSKIEFITKYQDGKEKSIITYNNKILKENKLFGEMHVEKSEINFDFNNLNLYKISENKNTILLVGQPMSWCGLANQFDIYQIIDTHKLEIIQFAEKDNWLFKN